MTIEWAESNPAQLIRRANWASLGKRIPENDTWRPTQKWCRSTVLSKDSTLEWACLIIDDDMRGDVSSHIVRHTAYHPRHVCQSWREDWTGKSRPTPETLRIYLGKWDIKALQSMARERLCYKAMKETMQEVERIKLYLLNSDDILMNAVGWSIVPDCIFQGGCSKGNRGCGWFDNGFDVDGWSSIEERYDLYNRWFNEHKTKEE